MKMEYLVGGLLSNNLTPELEQAKLNEWGSQGWELVSVVAKQFDGQDYVFYYFLRQIT